MRKPQSVKALEALGRVQLSPHFFMRDFLYSEIAVINGFTNLPDDPDLAIAAGTALCQNLLEPLQARFGRLSIRSAYRSAEVNQFGNINKLNCATNPKNFAGHIWDRRDAQGHMGATACLIVNSVIPYYAGTGDWQALAWWIHDHLPYSRLQFFPQFCAFNLQWHEQPQRSIYSYIPPQRGWLTRPGHANWAGPHDQAYVKMLNETR